MNENNWVRGFAQRQKVYSTKNKFKIISNKEKNLIFTDLKSAVGVDYQYRNEFKFLQV